MTWSEVHTESEPMLYLGVTLSKQAVRDLYGKDVKVLEKEIEDIRK